VRGPLETAPSQPKEGAATSLARLGSSRDLLLNLTLREIRGKYKRTVLGQAWSLLNPIAQMVTYSIVFSLLLRAQPAPGDPSGLDVFALWLSAGLLPWLFFQNVVMSGMGVLVGNSNLIKKVYFPRETLVISNAASWLFTFSIEMTVLTVAVLIFGGSPLLYLPATIFFMIVLAAFGLGVSFVLAVSNVYFRDTQHFIGILMQVWFYATPIVYPIALVAEHRHNLLTIYRLNPLERFTEVFRNTMYDGRWPTLSNTLYLVLVSAAALALGYVVFKRYEGRLAEEL
jgi:ABC-type polysaccharide/polyol phosphate export permease